MRPTGFHSVNRWRGVAWALTTVVLLAASLPCCGLCWEALAEVDRESAPCHDSPVMPESAPCHEVAGAAEPDHGSAALQAGSTMACCGASDQALAADLTTLSPPSSPVYSRLASLVTGAVLLLELDPPTPPSTRDLPFFLLFGAFLS